MASNSSPQLFIEDEDMFDWDAAMREVDMACLAQTAQKPIPDSETYPGSQPIAGESAEEMKPKRPNVSACSPVTSAPPSTLHNFFGDSSRISGKDKTTQVSSRSSNKDLIKSDSQNGFDGKSNGEKIDASVSENDGWGMLNQFIKIDPETAKNWIYPVNFPRRDYQFSITKTSLFSNTLVVLPTGLGKTLIAAVVMYNFFRWFPEGKIVFAAPSRPLVLQQIQACHKIVGIPQEWTIDLTGQTNPTRRAEFWKSKRVFFVTPQVLEKDIHSGSLSVKELVCMVIDEAHRAMGNYSYCVAVRELMDTPVQLRILALTATPGYKKQTIQQVIDNLQISSIEYRTETDPDVLPYVNERKIDLIEVSMGDAAVEINNLLSEVARPFVSRLSALRVLYMRDFDTLSPCHLLNSRDKFRQEPPTGLHDANYGEIEGYFGVLITLYHIKKLLSSHGIQPAFDMLDEKMKQGCFVRFVSRNEILLKAKLLMEQTISTGAPSPKLAKLLEVLNDHYKRKDPKSSRVIIFSNFRGSVREILNALKSIGDVVKATEFIGQSSGKTTKGQSQKAQQAVLEKFRAGGFNIIVATSIGEEGLDIMEVDLVICFDANISPLRMIQRMGRTGRQHEGRVVVLACEGPELKGYIRKQAHSKGVKKHMKNGGIKSFNFHTSPRMVPHIFNPEVLFLEMSIKEFVHRRKKVKDEDNLLFPECATKLTDAETHLIAKYFTSGRETTWRPSLIAFPQFQACLSPVNRLLHSSKSGILSDAMRQLQAIKFPTTNKTFSAEEYHREESNLRDEVVQPSDEEMEDDVVDPLGGMPALLPMDLTSCTGVEAHAVRDHLGNDNLQDENNIHLHSRCQRAECMPGNDPDGDNEVISNSPASGRRMEFSAEDDIDLVVRTDEAGHDLHSQEAELSPRLTSFIESGIVPESPVNTAGTRNEEEGIFPLNVPCLQVKLFRDNCEEDAEGSNHDAWRASPSFPVDQPCKYRRLRKIGDPTSKMPVDSEEPNGRSRKLQDVPNEHPAVERKQKRRCAIYIEDEAEDSMGSSADEDEPDDSLYEDSFIDDGVNPTPSPTASAAVASSPASVTGSKMMAFYRQSLLSQSLFRKPASESSNSQHCDTGLEESTGKTYVGGGTRRFSIGTEEDIPRVNLEQQFEDDLFYQGIDLDAVEEEAAKIIRSKTQFEIPVCGSPSFDLGI